MRSPDASGWQPIGILLVLANVVAEMLDGAGEHQRGYCAMPRATALSADAWSVGEDDTAAAGGSAAVAGACAAAARTTVATPSSMAVRAGGRNWRSRLTTGARGTGSAIAVERERIDADGLVVADGLSLAAGAARAPVDQGAVLAHGYLDAVGYGTAPACGRAGGAKRSAALTAKTSGSASEQEREAVSGGANGGITPVPATVAPTHGRDGGHVEFFAAVPAAATITDGQA